MTVKSILVLSCLLMLALSNVQGEIGNLAVAKSESLQLNKKQRLSCDAIIPYTDSCDRSYEKIDSYCDKWSSRIDGKCDQLFNNLKSECNKSEKKIKKQCVRKYGYMTSNCGQRLDNLEMVCRSTSDRYSTRCAGWYRSMDNVCYKRYKKIDLKCRRIYNNYEDLCESDLRVNYWDKKFTKGEFDIDAKGLHFKQLKEFTDLETNIDDLYENVAKTPTKKPKTSTTPKQHKVNTREMREYADYDDEAEQYLKAANTSKKPTKMSGNPKSNGKKPIFKQYLEQGLTEYETEDDSERGVAKKTTAKPVKQPAAHKSGKTKPNKKPSVIKGFKFDLSDDQEDKMETKTDDSDPDMKTFDPSYFEDDEEKTAKKPAPAKGKTPAPAKGKKPTPKKGKKAKTNKKPEKKGKFKIDMEDDEEKTAKKPAPAKGKTPAPAKGKKPTPKKGKKAKTNKKPEKKDIFEIDMEDDEEKTAKKPAPAKGKTPAPAKGKKPGPKKGKKAKTNKKPEKKDIFEIDMEDDDEKSAEKMKLLTKEFNMDDFEDEFIKTAKGKKPPSNKGKKTASKKGKKKTAPKKGTKKPSLKNINFDDIEKKSYSEEYLKKLNSNTKSVVNEVIEKFDDSDY